MKIKGLFLILTILFFSCNDGVKNKQSYKNNINDSLVIPLNKSGLPIDPENDLEEIDNYQILGNVFARIIFEIPSYTR